MRHPDPWPNASNLAFVEDLYDLFLRHPRFLERPHFPAAQQHCLGAVVEGVVFASYDLRARSGSAGVRSEARPSA